MPRDPRRQGRNGFIPRAHNPYHRNQNVRRALEYGEIGLGAAAAAGAAAFGLSRGPARGHGQQEQIIRQTPPRRTLRNEPSTDTPDTIDMSRRNDDDDEDMRLAVDVSRNWNTEANASAEAKTSKIASASGGKGVQETPITRTPPSWGIPETHTTVIPLTTYFTPALLDHGACVPFEFRLNCPYDPIQSAPGAPVAGAALSKGLFNSQVGSSNSWPATLSTYPVQPTGGDKPGWIDYFDTLYDVYTVIGCKWRLTAQNPQTVNGQGAIIGWGIQTYGSASAGNVYPASATLNETFMWQDLSYKICSEVDTEDRSGGIAVIADDWYPGKGKRNVTNDEDVTTWTAVGSAPSFKEELKLMFWKAPLASGNGVASGFGHTSLNCMLSIEWIVQFKDLKQEARYPFASGATTRTQTTPGDLLQLY